MLEVTYIIRVPHVRIIPHTRPYPPAYVSIPHRAIPMIIDMNCRIQFYILIVISLPTPATPVRGCVTYVAGEDYSMRQSICDKPDTHFLTIPASLPSQVVKLTVNHQDISELNASQFRHLPNLTYLDLDSNKIIRIHPNTFHVLKHLRILSLRFNLLTFGVNSFHPDVPHGLIYLESLNLLQNPMGYVPKRIFAPLGSSLRVLVLSGGSEDFQLDPGALEGLTMLQVLDLSYNHLETLHESFETTIHHMQLKELYLYGNPWRCDCNLRWLKVWFLKVNTKLIYSRPVPEGVNRNLLDPSAQRWYDYNYGGNGDAPSLLQPRCASPYALFGRPLFSHQTLSGLQPVRTTDFHCLPQALTPNQPIQIMKGSNATITCEFFADPTGIVVWYRNGTLIQQRWERMSMHQTTGRTFQAELTIKDVQSIDAGTYVCFLDTGHGRVNTTFSVQVSTEDQHAPSKFKEGVFRWINRLNTTLVLKYTGIIASCLIMLLIIIGLFIYCFYGRRNRLSKTEIDRDHVTKHLEQDSYLNNESPAKLHSNTGTYDYLPPRPISAPQSSLVRRERFPAELKENGVREMQLMSPTGEKIDNYVTLRILPTDSKGDLVQRCSMHNYAIIHPVGPNSVLLDGGAHSVITLPSSDQLMVNPSTESTPLSRTDPSHLLVFKEPESHSHNMDFSGIIQSPRPVVPGDQDTGATSSDFTPCPLHGHIYASLHPQQKDRRENVEVSKRHIATMPAGLGTVHEKRTSTLPTRRKSPGSGSGSYTTAGNVIVQAEACDGLGRHTVGNASSNPDITSNEPRTGPELKSNKLCDSNVVTS
ncbi:Leucine-rich repeat-containing protein 4 [Fasciola hepatica]|uniref:Leucine-rich repeat-containing protein 4 n=1 Tax=Fasciola hepatica TaxID=6192 RepID=A0A2H1CPY5_FASHE|nr:Leucine-rich repeat-containing protein 4 [Fasciola hepatica]